LDEVLVDGEERGEGGKEILRDVSGADGGAGGGGA